MYYVEVKALEGPSRMEDFRTSHTEYDNASADFWAHVEGLDDVVTDATLALTGPKDDTLEAIGAHPVFSTRLTVKMYWED